MTSRRGVEQPDGAARGARAGFPVDRARARFPSLSLSDGAHPRVYFDNPAGTQVPEQMLDRMSAYLLRSVGNGGGAFRTSVDTDALMAEAREGMAQFFNARSPREVVFGAAMTALTLHMTHALEALFAPGDEVIVTRMDHDGNVSPWRLLAQRRGLKLKWLDFDGGTYRYDLAGLDRLLTSRTRLVAVNHASNITGTINDVAAITRSAKAVGAMVYVDSVQFAPHGVIDVQALGCDFLVCSAYKFFGPHLGVLWGREELLERLSPPKVRAATDELPFRYELGTPPFELLAALLGTLEYYAWVGDITAGPRAAAAPLGERIGHGKRAMQEYEDALALRLIEGLQGMPGVRIHGITAAAEMRDRISTVSFSVEGVEPLLVARKLAQRGIYVWNGHNFAVDMIEKLGLNTSGGVVRVGPVHYNTVAEIDSFLEAMRGIVRRNLE
jgi:cysteine desulfurase family protein (TIGR01976 family)